jgi:tetratricopeptide (TPR) repeat protein
MADIFVSYTSSDREWAFWVAKELEALGHTPHIHEWEIRSGADIYAWMERRHDVADHVLCVISDDYLKAPYATLERNAALWQAASKRPGFVLLVAVKQCRFPTLTDHLHRCELYGISDEQKRERFREFMSKRDAPTNIVLPGAYAVSNIPIRVPTLFMGRDDALEAIEMALRRYEGRVAITALHGLRGVGKTTLAAAYAERHRSAYRVTWWIRAQGESSMRADLVALGVRLGWVAADEKEEPALVAVLERLRHEGEGCLLIYDNAVDADVLKPYLPLGGGAQVLVTSNAHAWRGMAAPVEIRLWPKDIGADYLIARTGRTGERDDALALSEALGGLPLAHEQAAAYCERLAIALAEYAKRFASAPAKYLDDARHAPAEYHDGLTVAKTFAVAIAEASRLHPAAEPLIVHAALLAPEPIPLFVFAEAREKFVEPLVSLLADEGIDEAVAALRTFALLDRESIVDERDPSITTDCIRLHPLVRQVAAARREGETRDTIRRSLIEAVGAVYPDDVWRDPDTWPRMRRVDALVLALAGGDTVPSGAEKRSSNLLSFAGQYRQHVLAAYSEARPLFERALALAEKALGPDHPDTATRLHNLAHLLQEQGDIAGARPLLERALAISEKALGPDHPYVATSLHNFAYLLQTKGDLAAARPLYERALAIYEKRLGLEDHHTAASLSCLASLREAEGDLTGARPLYQRALAIYDKALDPEHPIIANNLNHVARLLQADGDLAAARPLYERALAIYEKVRGPEHPHTLIVLVKLASVLHEQGDLPRAQQLYERALAISEKVFGPEHAQTAVNLHLFAHLLRDQGDLAAAWPLYERVVAITEKTFGPEHPETANALNDLACLLHHQKHFAEARILFERALAIREKVYGPEAPHTGTILNNLGSILEEEGDLTGAQLLFARALAIDEKALGPNHPELATVLSNLARVLNRIGHVTQAEVMFQRAIALDEKTLGPEHEWTQRHRSHYARLFLNTGRAADARAMAEAALAVHAAKHGRNHPWTKDSARVTADALDALGRTDEAAALRERYEITPTKTPSAL